MKVGDLVRLTEYGCFHPEDDYLELGIVLEIKEDYYNVGDGPILRSEGCYIRWSDGTFTVEPIQFIEKVTWQMKKTLVTLLSLGLLGCSTWADRRCERHKIGYFKNFCLADRSGDISYCENINDHLLKTTCRAKVQRRERVCYDIESTQDRQWCLTMIK